MANCIKDITIDVIERAMPLAVGIEHTYAKQQTVGLLRINTDDGIEGHCFIGAHWKRPEMAFQPIIDIIKPMLVGRDSSDREWLWTQHNYLCSRSRLTNECWAPVDIALWDIAGKMAQQPIYKLLGAQRDRVDAYVSYPVQYETPDGFVGEAEESMEQGFRAYKIHPGLMVTADVVKTIDLVRRQVGNDYALMFDPNCGYRFNTALNVGHALDAQGFKWYEDPLPYNQFDGFRELSQSLRTPLAICDQAPNQLFESAQYINQRASRIIRGTALKLGITGLRKLCSLAEGNRMNCEMGTAGNPLINAANLHVILSIANCDFYECYYPKQMEQYGLRSYVETDSNGVVIAPNRPGLGYAIDEDWISVHKLETLH